MSGPAAPSASGPTSASAARADQRGGGQLRVLRRQRARGDAVGDGLGDDVTERPAEHQPLGVDGGSTGSASRAYASRGDFSARPAKVSTTATIRSAALPGPWAASGHGVDFPGHHGAEQLDGQFGLAREVLVDAAGGDPGPGRDGGHRAARVALLGQERDRRGERSAARWASSRACTAGVRRYGTQELKH